MEHSEIINSATAHISGTSKNRQLAPTFVRSVVEKELRETRSLDEITKSSKSKLHQMVGAYLRMQPRFDQWLERMQQASICGQQEQLKFACRETMKAHSSTYERLAILDEFYQVIFSECPNHARILDLACGLHPLAAPWMPIDWQQVSYTAVDVHSGMMSFLQSSMELLGVNARCLCQDACAALPEESYDLVFLLKSLPTLAQLRPGCEKNLLTSLKATSIVVSYPLQSLGGHTKGMLANYRKNFENLVSDLPFEAKTFTFRNELLYILRRQAND